MGPIRILLLLATVICTVSVAIGADKPDLDSSGASFIAKNPGLMVIIFGAMVAIIIYLYNGKEAAFKKGLGDMQEAMADALDRVANSVEKLDTKMDNTLGEAFRRIGQLESELSHLRGEHDARKGLCVSISTIKTGTE